MTNTFQRARSAEAKEQRENDILQAARRLAAEQGIRAITLTEIANTIGMHKSALLRYFETREQIFLVLAGQGWREWSPALRAALEEIETPGSQTVAEAFARTLVARPLFCDLLAHVPLNLERNVSVERVRAFKLIALEEVAAIAAKLEGRIGLSRAQAVNIISTATSMAGALWQMATPGPDVARLYREEPLLAHAVVDVESRLVDILSGLMTGYLAKNCLGT
ncbi:TetR family transcriptional regulator [Shinella sp. CPCC 101442]|uniref:TetR/AcrR family transcriptional regulator n=1 Tax=Shinella sp. CPCC 101442 TaxID=2932265 RepID=UPI0021530F62|nr:TetR family transcriptional regulator [Shinella sp. CPCC 101442]MCR6502928.1 TetR family transcriptional regulator [Shinella sp. CPCC 101442]